jgi:NodT family efflux transporter outer membrane factor (OMF) lipoprotein
VKSRARQALLLAGTLLLPGGCARHQPQTIALPAPLPAHYAEDFPGSGTEAVGRWWKAFGDERLDALVEEALAANLDLRQAYARLDQLRALTETTASAGKPSLTFRGQTSVDHQPGLTEGHTGVNYRLSLEAGYEVDLWKKLESREEAARLDEEAAVGDIETLYLTLAARVVDLYYLAVEQRAQLDLVDRTVASFEDALTRVEERYRQGLVPSLDIYQARQNLSQARAGRPLFETSLARSEHALSLLIGRYPGGESFGDIVTLPPAPAAWPAGIPSELLTRRPDIRAAHRRLEASDARTAAAVADRFPSFNLLGGLGVSGVSLATGDITGIFWNFLAGLSQPILDGGRREAEVERREALFREGLARYQQNVLRAFGEVEDALVANAATETRIARLAERVEATRNALRISNERYLQGLSDYLQVLSNQIFHFDAQTKLLSARRQLIADRVSLARSLGGTWAADEVEDRLTAVGTQDSDGAIRHIAEQERDR